jgi:hypothetical protein
MGIRVIRLHEMAKKNALKAAISHLKSAQEVIRDYKDGVAEPWCTKYDGDFVKVASGEAESKLNVEES